MKLGLETVAERVQVLTGRPPANPFPSLLLGAEPMTPLEVAELYGTFASGGFHMRPKAVIAVLDETGTALSRHSLALEQRIGAEPARALGYALESAMRYGTGAASRFSRSGTAGKTGTSDDYRDSWFAGYDDAHLTVVWVGADDNGTTGLTGSAGALKVWDAVMGHLGVQPLFHADRDLRTIDYRSGLLTSGNCANAVQVPLPDDVTLRRQPGCDINPGSLSQRLQRWLSND
jgi:penicillin-binding protein 1B